MPTFRSWFWSTTVSTSDVSMTPMPFLHSDRRPSRRRAWAFVALLAMVTVVPSSVARAQRGGEDEAVEAPSRDDRALHVHLVRLQNQPAEEAMRLVMPLLSPQGSVEIQPGGNTLVVRDTLASLSTMLPLLADFDHSRRSVRVEVWILRASPAQVSPPGATSPEIRELPGIVDILQRHLPYSDYELVTKSEVRSREGEYAAVSIGQGFEVRFRPGTVIGNQRLRLGGFELLRESTGDAKAKLLKSDLNLWVDRPVVVALVNSTDTGAERSTLLIVVRIELPGSSPPDRRDER